MQKPFAMVQEHHPMTTITQAEASGQEANSPGICLGNKDPD
jgi:hypothetical protein